MSNARQLAANLPREGGLSNRNLIINGAMQVAQRGTSATVSNNTNEGYSTVDRFYLNFNANVAGGIDFSQSSDAPSGFANSIKLQCSTTNTSFATTNAINLEYRPEAQDLQCLGYGTSDAKEMTISWYMKAVNFLGPISLALETRDGTAEYYAKSYTPTTSWTRYTCTVPASTSATINNDNGQGMFVKFVIAGFSGGTYAASADSTAWSTTRVDYVDDIGNFTSSTSNELYITGVQLEVGDTATPFEHRSYGDELARCQRYFQRFETGSGSQYYLIFSAYTSATNALRSSWKFDPPMRATPTLSRLGNLNLNPSLGTLGLSMDGGSTDGVRLNLDHTSSATIGRSYNLYGAYAGFEFDAEL